MSHRGAVFALVTVALWVPELRLLLTGGLTPTGGLVRMGLAVVVAWAGVALVTRIVASYQDHNEKAAAPPGEDQAL